MTKPRFYHASPRRFRHGDLLTGGHDGGYGYPHPNVCMTNSPAPHGTVAHKAVEENWLVYEVQPNGTVTHNEGNGEYQARSATVLQCVGRAAALAAKPQPGARAEKTEWKVSPEDKADNRRNPTKRFESWVPCVPVRGVRIARPWRKYVWRGLEAEANRDRKIQKLIQQQE
jgi:hypothetical protein